MIVSIPITGPYHLLRRNNIKAFEMKIDQVLLHFRDKELVGTVSITGSYEELHEKALKLVDRSVTTLCYLVKHKFETVKNACYIKEKPNASIERVSKSLTILYNIGGKQESAITPSKISSVEAKKKKALEKALGYYRVAIESQNPFKAIDTYFSAISAIVRENTQENNLHQSHLEQQLKYVIVYKRKKISENSFKQKFDRFYAKRRSASSHGHIDITDLKKAREAKVDAEELRKWTDELIDEYINKNQSS